MAIIRSSKEQLIQYFIKNIKKSYDPYALKWALINQGYSRTLVESALEEAQKQMAKEVPQFKEVPRINYQILDENNRSISIKKPWWRRLFGF